MVSADEGATRMAGKKKRMESSDGKDCWHIYSLQSLPPKKFVDVVNKVIRGQYRMVTSRNGIMGALPAKSLLKKRP